MNFSRIIGGFSTIAVTLGLAAATPAAAAVVASTCTPSAGTTCFNLTLATTTATSDDYLVYYANPGGVNGAKSIGSEPSTFGVSVSVGESIPSYISSGYATALGLYTDTSGNTGVVVALNSSASTAALGQPFSTVFPSYSESSIVNDLQTGNTTALESFLNAYSSDFFNYTSGASAASGSLIGFSNGTLEGSIGLAVTSLPASGGGGGSGSPSAAPEPSTYLLMGAGLVLLAGLRSKKQFSRLF